MSFAHLTLATRDVTGTKRFFERTFGWRAIDRPANIEIVAAWLDVGSGQELHLLEDAAFEPSAFEKEFGRHVAVNYPGSEFDKLKSRLREAGAELIDPLRETPFERFFFKDPNGYVFEVVDADRA